MLCPCGSSLPFNACCQPFITTSITQKNYPTTPEQLMRSRFSAYAIKDGQYIFDTYGATQRLNLSISDIQTWADECIWIALTIHSTTVNSVDFSAYYVVDNTLCELREHSNFRLEQGLWRYIDGDISVNQEITHLTRNDECPCNNYVTAWSTKKNKKFKHCCGK